MDIALMVDRLRPAAKWRMADTYEHLVETWSDPRPVPTLAELEAEWETYSQNWEATGYKRLRAEAYPVTKDQLEAISDAIKAIDDAAVVLFNKTVKDWLAEIQSVKNRYPKP